MKTMTNKFSLMFTILFFSAFAAMSQNATNKKEETKNQPVMKTYVIEREIPGAGKLNQAELKAASQKSCAVLTDIGPKIKWIQSYVTADKLYCIYQAENEELIREHARKSGFPANKISELATIISPATAEN